MMSKFQSRFTLCSPSDANLVSTNKYRADGSDTVWDKHPMTFGGVNEFPAVLEIDMLKAIKIKQPEEKLS